MKIFFAILALLLTCASVSFAGPATTQSLRFEVTGPADGHGNSLVTFDVDATGAPEHREWARRAAANAIKWYPKIAELLAEDGFTPPRKIALVMKDMKGVAHTSNDTITVAAKWVHDHPDDDGVVVHEMVHVIQAYRTRGNPGWLVEGIADYLRYYVADADSPRKRFDANRQKYTDGYQPAAELLDWLERTKGPGVMNKLNAAMRSGKFSDAAFRDIAGDDPDALWTEFKESLSKPQK